MTRVLPAHRAALVGCRHRHRFAKVVGWRRPLPAGFKKGLTRR